MHIKRTRREYIQLFKNIFIFYYASIEQTVEKQGETIVSYVKKILETDVFPMRKPKIIKQFIQAIGNIKRVTGIKKQNFDMKETEFYRYFATENIIGITQMTIKKLLTKQITTDFNYMPADHLFCISDKNLKQHFISSQPPSPIAANSSR